MITVYTYLLSYGHHSTNHVGAAIYPPPTQNLPHQLNVTLDDESPLVPQYVLY